MTDNESSNNHSSNNNDSVDIQGLDIVLTADHLLPVIPNCNSNRSNKMRLMRAKDITTNDCLLQITAQQSSQLLAKVSQNKDLSESAENAGINGVFTIATSNGDFLVINGGLLASPFAVNHWFAMVITRVFSGFPMFASVLETLAMYFS